jgi:ferritin
MLKENIEDAINGQINAEFYSSYLYLSMSAYFDSIDLKGMASWMIAQAQEEIAHGMKMYNHVQERGGTVTLDPIEGPPTAWDSALDVYEHALRHEEHVTSLINSLVDLAISEKDHATKNFLDWFVDEQVEEEATASEVVQQLKIIGDNGYGILMLDRELGQRVFTPPAPVE